MWGKIVEIFVLIKGILTVLVEISIDDFSSLFFSPQKRQLQLHDLLHVSTLSQILQHHDANIFASVGNSDIDRNGGKIVKAVKGSGNAIDDNGKTEEIGAGGTGTCRGTLVLHVANSSSSSTSSSTSSSSSSSSSLLAAGGEREREMKLFYKIPTNSLFERAFLSLFKVYENELKFYNRLAPTLPSSDWTPKCFYAGNGTLQAISRSQNNNDCSAYGGKFLLLVEDVNARNDCKFYSILQPYPKERAFIVLSQMARFHAHFIKNKPKKEDLWSYDGVTGQPIASTPPFLSLIGESTMKQIVKRFVKSGKLKIPDDVYNVYHLGLENFTTIRKYWSSEAPLTACHGDSHIGNYFFYTNDVNQPSAGIFDMQCVAIENVMRDVSYHFISSYSSDDLANDEKEFILFYLNALQSELQFHHGLSFEKAYFLYRVQSLWTLYAFVISAGASDLMIEEISVPILHRIFTTCNRLNTLQAITDILH